MYDVKYYDIGSSSEKKVKWRMALNALGQIVDNNGNSHDRNGMYGYIPACNEHVMDELIFVAKYTKQDARAYKTLSFLDAGCGIGMTLILARSLGFCAHGIEINPELIEKARVLIGNHSITISKSMQSIIYGDILTFKKYNKFDIIYYYCPFKDQTKQTDFELKVENDMKPGAILIANLKRDMCISKDKRFKKITNNMPIWEKMYN